MIRSRTPGHTPSSRDDIFVFLTKKIQFLTMIILGVDPGSVSVSVSFTVGLMGFLPLFMDLYPSSPG